MEWPCNFRLGKAATPLSDRPRKRFGQKRCPKWFFADSVELERGERVTVPRDSGGHWVSGVCFK